MGYAVRRWPKRVVAAVGRGLLWGLREMYRGLVAVGLSMYGWPTPLLYPPPRRPARDRDTPVDHTAPHASSPRPSLSRPAPGHPERLLPLAPLTATERRLWAQLQADTPAGPARPELRGSQAPEAPR